MLTKEGAIQLLVIIFLEFISFYRFCAQSQSCYEVDNKTVCYFRPTLATAHMSWDDAWIVCKDHNATLPITENRRIEETLINYVQSKAPSVGEVWLAGREIRTNVWQWFNEKPFGRQSIIKEKGTYDTNVVITRKLEYLADYPTYERHYICQCTDCIMCQNKEAIRYEDGCIFVYNHENLNLVKARNRCLDKGGDLATFEKDEDLSVFQQNRSLLHEYERYWIGLRQNWWIWNETESNKEIKYSNWYIYENVLNEECLFLRLSYFKKWSQSSCTVTKPFICQRVITPVVDELDTSTTSVPKEKASSSGFTIEIIVAAVIAAIVVIVLIILMMILKKARSKGVTASSADVKPALSAEKSTQPVESKNAEVSEMSNHYAEIPRAAHHDDNEACEDERQPGVVYATLEFDASKAVYEEPVISKQRTSVADASEKDGTSRVNIQTGGFGAPSTQSPEVTIYANV